MPPIPHQHLLRRPILLEPPFSIPHSLCCSDGKISLILSLHFPFLISMSLYYSLQTLGLAKTAPLSPRRFGSKETCRWFSCHSRYWLPARDAVRLLMQLSVVLALFECKDEKHYVL